MTRRNKGIYVPGAGSPLPHANQRCVKSSIPRLNFLLLDVRESSLSAEDCRLPYSVFVSYGLETPIKHVIEAAKSLSGT